ncbi:HNH endonuclease [Microcoleus sp. AS-A8]
MVLPSQPVSELTSGQISRLTKLYQKVGYLIDETLEKWVKDFRYEFQPDREIQIWEEMAIVFEKYNKTHPLSFAQRRDVLKRLIQLVGGEELQDPVSIELVKLFKQEQASRFCIRPHKPQASWGNIDSAMFAHIYREYVKRHPVGIHDSKVQGRGDAEMGRRGEIIQTGIETPPEPEYEPLNLRYSGGERPLGAIAPDFGSNSLRVPASPTPRVFFDELFVTLMRLMEGKTPASELGQELLKIWEDLQQAGEQDFNPDDIKDERQKRKRAVVNRPGQKKFKHQLMKAYGGCCSITGCSVEAVLQAAHIIPYLGTKTDHPSNGLLLRVDIHKLFDIHYLSINPKTNRVEMADVLKNTVYWEIAGQALRIPKSKTERPNSNALSKHYQVFESRWFKNA